MEGVSGLHAVLRPHLLRRVIKEVQGGGHRRGEKGVVRGEGEEGLQVVLRPHLLRSVFEELRGVRSEQLLGGI